METGTKKIKSIRLYECGYCVNRASHLLKRAPKTKVRFGAWVALLEHAELGFLLYDTGYSPLLYRNGLLSLLYQHLNPTFCRPADTIRAQLLRSGIKPQSVRKIILSHAHPDHMGALPLFESYDLLATKEVLATLSAHRVRDLVFPSLMPPAGVRKICVSQSLRNTLLNPYFEQVYDILGDQSILGVSLNGHAKGQLGIYLPEYRIFFAADAAWSEGLARRTNTLKFLPKLIQNNRTAYSDTLHRIQNFQKDFPNIKIIYSHGKNEGLVFEK